MATSSAQPSPFQLALALAITRTKPLGITVREYITKIRQHIVAGTAAQDYGSRDKYIDAAGHWRAMYQQSQHEIERLQVSVLSLECDKVKLESQLSILRREPVVQVKQEDAEDASRPATTVVEEREKERPSTAQPRSTVPRKRGPPVFIDDTRLQHKKLKMPGGGAMQICGAADAPIVIADDLARFEEPKGLEPTIMRHLISIHKLYQKDAYDSSALAHHLIHATRGIAEQITTHALRIQTQLQQASLTKDKKARLQRTTHILGTLSNDFSKSKRAAARSFMSLYHGLETMWSKGIESGLRNHAIVTYEMICAFDKFLEAIEKTCEIQATMVGDEDVGAKAKGAGGDAKKRKDRRVDGVPVPQEVTALLLALLGGLEPMKNADGGGHQPGPHSAFFEGCLYLLLDRVAKKLVLLTFKHAPGKTIEEQIAMGDEEPEVDATVLKAANLEVQFLVQLVDRAMSLAPGFLGTAALSTMTAKSRPARPASRSGAKVKAVPSLSLMARERLQHTLVRCMFGEFPRTVHGDDSDTEDEEGEVSKNEFIDVLRKPVRVHSVSPPPSKVEEVDVPSWFREEIWRMVGWDILGREDGW